MIHQVFLSLGYLFGGRRDGTKTRTTSQAKKAAPCRCCPPVSPSFRAPCYNFRMNTLKVTQIGNSLGVILPKEILTRLKLERGDAVHVTESPDGITLTPYDPALDEQVELGREFMREYRDTFRQLAK